MESCFCQVTDGWDAGFRLRVWWHRHWGNPRDRRNLDGTSRERKAYDLVSWGEEREKRGAPQVTTMSPSVAVLSCILRISSVQTHGGGGGRAEAAGAGFSKARRKDD